MTNTTTFLGLAILLGLALLLTFTVGCASTPPATAAAPIEVDGAPQKLEGQRYLEYRVGTVIDADPATVWALLTDAGAYPRWNSTVVDLQGSIAAGEEIKLRSTVDPKRTFKLRVSTFEPNARLVWEDGGRAFKGVRTFTLRARDDGRTEVTMAEVFTGSMMKMIAPKLPDFRPSFAAFAADLKRAAEGPRG